MSEGLFLFGGCEQTPCSGCDDIAGYTLVGEFDIDSVSCMSTTCGTAMDWSSTPGNTLVAAGTYASGVGTSHYILRYKAGFMQRCLDEAAYYYQAIYKETSHASMCTTPTDGPSQTGWWIRTHLADSSTVTWVDVWSNACGYVEFDHHNNRDMILWWTGGMGYPGRPPTCTEREVDIGGGGRTWKDYGFTGSEEQGSGNWTCCLFRED
jgi:hypothetical protein